LLPQAHGPATGPAPVPSFRGLPTVKPPIPGNLQTQPAARSRETALRRDAAFCYCAPVVDIVVPGTSVLGVRSTVPGVLPLGRGVGAAELTTAPLGSVVLLPAVVPVIAPLCVTVALALPFGKVGT